MDIKSVLTNVSYVELVAALLLVIIGSVALARWTFSAVTRSKKGDLILLLGPCGAGKTSLFYKWSEPSLTRPLTVTSQSANRGNFFNHQVIDYPGHPRLWHGVLALLPKTSRIVYLLDATADETQLKPIAENLYDLLVSKHLQSSRCRMLICLNKTDASKKSLQETLVALNKEMDTLRTSRAQELEGDNAADQFLGFEDEPFDLKEHAPIKVEFGTCSVLKSRISEIETFIRCS